MRVYLDWNATTPPLADVTAAMFDAARTAWGNPSSIHGHGRAARAVVEDARASVGALVGADPRDVLFTSGGTEANNLAIRSAFAHAPPSAWLVTSRLEHPSVTKVAEALEREGRARVRWVCVERTGVLALDDLRDALATSDPIALVTAQAVNHETGVVQPLEAIMDLVRAKAARVHVDAVQAWGRVAVPAGADTMSLAGHKMRGPKGIGALVVRAGTTIEPVLLGGAQEKGLRPGTTDPTLAAGLGVAARWARANVSSWARIAVMRDRLERALEALGPRAPKIVGQEASRAAHVSTGIWHGWAGAELVAALDLEGISVSSGAACSAGTVEPSPVLQAMFGATDAGSGLRVSMGDLTTEADVDAAIAAFVKVATRSP